VYIIPIWFGFVILLFYTNLAGRFKQTMGSRFWHNFSWIQVAEIWKPCKYSQFTIFYFEIVNFFPFPLTGSTTSSVDSIFLRNLLYILSHPGLLPLQRDSLRKEAKTGYKIIKLQSQLSALFSLFIYYRNSEAF
jgi:hypothetical protein